MGVDERRRLIAELETQLNCRVIALVTGDRQHLETRIAPDILPLISEHLSRIGATDRLALFLYTPGGDTIVGWGLVNLMRQYCRNFLVLVPFRALSCGTLIALGADEVVIGRHGLLSPVDPSVMSPFMPSIPGGQPGEAARLIPVSVEDMIGFLDLARKEVKLTSEASMIEVLKILAQQVHPLALGAVYRAREQSSRLAARLLQKHMTDADKIDGIVKRLTQELPTHSYLIGRREAADEIGLPITQAPENVDNTMWALYKEYEGWMRLTQPASPELDLGTETERKVQYERAAVESLKDHTIFQHVYVSMVDLLRVKAPRPGLQVPVDQVVERVLYMGWQAAAHSEEAKHAPDTTN